MPAYPALSLLIAAQTNFSIAILARNQHLVNFVCRLAVGVPIHWPLSLRRIFAKVYHIGGLHVGAALAGATWYTAFVATLVHTVSSSSGQLPIFNAGQSIAFILLILAMIAMAMLALSFRTASLVGASAGIFTLREFGEHCVTQCFHPSLGKKSRFQRNLQTSTINSHKRTS